MTMYAVDNKYIHICDYDSDYHIISVPVGIKEINRPEKYCCDILIDTETGIKYLEKDLFKSKEQAQAVLKKKIKLFLELNNWEELLPYIEEIVKDNRDVGGTHGA